MWKHGVQAVRRLLGRDVEPPLDIGPDSLAYIFFTSGSTGAPKGVYDNHRNVLHNVLRYTNALEISPADRLTLLQGPAFSGCLSSQFGAFLNGASSFPLRLSEEGLMRTAAWLRRERITIYHSVPSIFRAVVRQGADFPDVRVVRLEGDRASFEDVELCKGHFPPDSVLANGLGTTETGLARQLVLSQSDLPTRGVLPVGYPVRDMAVRLVDEHRAPVPNGEVGEIAVASEYLALGYWNRQDLTEQRFQAGNGARMYFTGDLGRLADDGCLEYLGRRENDLKVLGTRVEPAEVEQELLRLDGVREAAVAVREGPRGSGQLIAYVVADHTSTLDLPSVRTALGERLPAVMLPTALVELDALPLDTNGKLDRRALPDPTPVRGGTGAPCDEQERWLAAIWREVLDVDSDGRADNFFALGGDSLAAAQIVARIDVETGHALPLAALVRSPTVAQLAAVLGEGNEARTSALTALRGGDSQPPLVLLHGNSGNALHYARLVARIDDARPLWALEYLDLDADPHVDTIVTAHLEVLSRAQPTGPYLLAGFCYGGVIAHELARRLAEDGNEAHVALLGITPLEFPTVVAPGACERWCHIYGPRPGVIARVRYHTRVAGGLERRDVAPYLAQRARNVGARTWGRLRRRHVVETRTAAQAAQAARALHQPQPFPGRPLAVLHRDDTALYTDRPGDTWATLGTDGVDVVVLTGGGHAMLEDGGVGALASVLGTWAASVAAKPL